MNIRPYLDKTPILGERSYIDPAATVIGDVILGEDASIWPGTVVRGDVNFIRVGARTNIQDGTVVHVSHDGPHAKLGGFATVIGADVTIGHKAIIHACKIEDAVLIGMGAVVLDGAVVKKHGFVGAGALVAPGKIVGEGELWLGNPAKKVRMLSDAEIEALYYSAQHYVRLKNQYLSMPSARYVIDVRIKPRPSRLSLPARGRYESSVLGNRLIAGSHGRGPQFVPGAARAQLADRPSSRASAMTVANRGTRLAAHLMDVVRSPERQGSRQRDARHLPRGGDARGRRPAPARRRPGAARAGLGDRPGDPHGRADGRRAWCWPCSAPPATGRTR